MNVKTLREQYKIIRNSDDYDKNMDFVDLLLSCEDREVVAYHYDLLRQRENRDLYLRLRAAFAKRGDIGAHFLVERIADEKDSSMRADLLHLLGTMRNSAALPLAREAVRSPDPELRARGCYVIGWMGKKEDIDLLRDRLLNDSDAKVRADAATAHDQLFQYSQGYRNKLLMNLKEALEKEKNKEVVGWIVVTVQYILRKRFGMKEDVDEAELIGDVTAAKRKCLEALERLKL